MTTSLELTRSQILAFRRRAAALDERLPHSRRALRRAAWAGLQDSMPRAALLSIHARMAGTGPGSWEDPALVQVWGPRFSTYVVAKRDLAVFTLGRLPDEPGQRKRIQEIAARLQSALAGRRPAPGGVPGICSQCSPGGAFPAHSKRRSKRRRPPCPCPGSTGPGR